MSSFEIYRDPSPKPRSARRLFASPSRKKKKSPRKKSPRKKSPRRSAVEKAYLKLLGKKARSKYMKGTLKYKRKVLKDDLYWYTKLLDGMASHWNASKVRSFKRDKKIIEKEAHRIDAMQRREDKEKDRKRRLLRGMR